MICMLELIWARARLVLCSASLLAGSPATNLQYTVQLTVQYRQPRHEPVELVLGGTVQRTQLSLRAEHSVLGLPHLEHESVCNKGCKQLFEG